MVVVVGVIGVVCDIVIYMWLDIILCMLAIVPSIYMCMSVIVPLVFLQVLENLTV